MDFEFKTRPATVGSTVALGDSAGGGCRFERGVGARTVWPLKAA